ncbi:MAG: hypothetical protein J5825_06760 [Lachnospiraceae bacterium]|nr:hypothetical protein [Lachnospiraceae bacterium]
MAKKRSDDSRYINGNVVIIVAGIVLTVLILAVVWIKTHDNSDKKPVKEPSNPGAAQTIVVTQKEQHSYKGVTDLTIKNGAGKKATLEFMNNSDNDCVQVVTIQNSDGVVLYKSDYIEAGKYLTQVELNQEFDPGTYPIQIWVRSYKNTEDHEHISGICYPRNLIVE